MTDFSRTTSEGAPDLEACAREPIHLPGSIQPQGALFVLDDSLVVLQAAIGPTLRPLLDAQVQGASIERLVSLARGMTVASGIGRHEETGSVYLGLAQVGATGPEVHAIAHRSTTGRLILELEQVVEDEPGSFDELYPYVQSFLAAVHAARSVEELGQIAAREVRRITGLDRALVYKFEEDGTGVVVAEDRNERLPSYLDLRFPATDIPAQARELYRLNRLRLIAAADYVPVPIEPMLDPENGEPVDLSYAVLRSVSPVHLEYMRNMGTGASMSISLLKEGQLWGLISCHDRDPRRVPYHVRTACDFIGQILSLQIAARENAALAQRRIELRAVQAKLLAHMAAEDHFIDALNASETELLGLTHATGAALLFAGECRLIGKTPPVDSVLRLAAWLGTDAREDFVATDRLAEHWPDAAALQEVASGVLAVSISQLHDSYVLWFRPEVVRTVSWGGTPHKPIEVTPAGARIHPRKSFDVWRETVHQRAVLWDAAEIEAALALRSAIVDIVLKGAEEMAQLNEQLLRSNKELEAFSYSVSHDLRAPFRHIVGYSELLKQNEGERLSERGLRYVDTIIESAVSAGTLVDDLLSFSQMGRASLHPVRVDMNSLIEEVRRPVLTDIGTRAVEWRIGELPHAYADPGMLRLVLQNLLDNAVKFTRGRDPAVIEVGGDEDVAETRYFVRDNGVGFDMAYVAKLFGVFQRLHRAEDFEGTGIGLANIKRIVEQRHGGRVWAEGKPDQGATLHFALPKAGRNK